MEDSAVVVTALDILQKVRHRQRRFLGIEFQCDDTFGCGHFDHNVISLF